MRAAISVLAVIVAGPAGALSAQRIRFDLATLVAPADDRLCLVRASIGEVCSHRNR